MRMCELRQKEVVNICTGKRLGCIVDVEIDIRCGEVEAVIIPGPGKICGFFGTDCEYVIPFSCIRRIGPDIILVERQEEVTAQEPLPRPSGRFLCGRPFCGRCGGRLRP